MAFPPASTEVDERRPSDPDETDGGFSHNCGGDGEGAERDEQPGVWPDTPNANLLDALSRWVYILLPGLWFFFYVGSRANSVREREGC